MNKKINSQYLIFSKTENDEIHYENLIFKKKKQKKNEWEADILFL